MKNLKLLFSYPAVTALVTAALSACSSSVTPGTDTALPARLDSAERVQHFLQADAHAMFRYAQFAVNPQFDSCPSHQTTGDTTTFSGGCTDSHGATFTGQLTVQRDTNSGTVTSVFDHFGNHSVLTCNGMSGSRTSTQTGTIVVSTTPTNGTFQIDLLIESQGLQDNTCETGERVITVQYSGMLNTVGHATTFNGSGRYGDSVDGIADANTVDEVINPDVCPPTGLLVDVNEPSSGNTTLASGGHEAIITYDGASSCDDPGKAPWTYDGVAQGQLPLW